MNDFSADWLARRETIDAASRSVALNAALCRGLAKEIPLKIVDLGSGTGSNLRYLAPLLEGPQEWLLVEHDAKLMAELPTHMHGWAEANGFSLESQSQHTTVGGASFQCRFACVHLDLATELDQVPLAGCHLLTASALLDLVSAQWLNELATRCQSAHTAVLFALTYDGQIAWSPTDPEDAYISDLVNRHQLTDKGFGPALGPDANHACVACFTEHGYRISAQPSEWRLGPQHQEIQQELLQNWSEATLKVRPNGGSRIRTWVQRRSSNIRAGRSALVVGHADVLGWPT